MSGEKIPQEPNMVPHSAIIDGSNGRKFQFQYEIGSQPSITEITEPTCISEKDTQCESREPNWGRRALIAGAAIFAGAVLVVSCGRDNESEKVSDETEQTTPGVSESEKACKTEMFPNGPFYANEKASPGDLHTTPTSGELDKKNNLLGYFFEDKVGITCNSALSLSVLTAIYENMVGEGSAKARGFDTQTTQKEQAGFYVQKPEEAQKDAQELARFMNTRAELNKEPITDAYFKVDKRQEGDTWVAVFVPVDITVNGPNKVWVINGGGYEGSGGDPSQKLLIDAITGQIYVLNAIGKIPIEEPEQTTDQPNPAGEQAPNPQESFGDTSQGQDDQNNGNDGTSSGRNKSGNNGGGGSGATGGTGGGSGGGADGNCGGGCAGGNGGSEPIPTQPGSTSPPPTRPPETVPPTRPPETVPPTRPPETVPPTTQPQPKGTIPGNSTTTLPSGF